MDAFVAVLSHLAVNGVVCQQNCVWIDCILMLDWHYYVRGIIESEYP